MNPIKAMLVDIVSGFGKHFAAIYQLHIVLLAD